MTWDGGHVYGRSRSLKGQTRTCQSRPIQLCAKKNEQILGFMLPQKPAVLVSCDGDRGLSRVLTLFPSFQRYGGGIRDISASSISKRPFQLLCYLYIHFILPRGQLDRGLSHIAASSLSNSAKHFRYYEFFDDFTQSVLGS